VVVTLYTDESMSIWTSISKVTLSPARNGLVVEGESETIWTSSLANAYAAYASPRNALEHAESIRRRAFIAHSLTQDGHPVDAHRDRWERIALAVGGD
jgi:hypothetical protein